MGGRFTCLTFVLLSKCRVTCFTPFCEVCLKAVSHASPFFEQVPCNILCDLLYPLSVSVPCKNLHLLLQTSVFLLLLRLVMRYPSSDAL